MWCPQCGREFRPGFTSCFECDVDLVESDPALRASPLTLASSAIQVFNFADKTVRDGDGMLLGSCGIERRVYVCRDLDGAVRWMWQQLRGSFWDGRVLNAHGHQIGTVRRGTLSAFDRPFAALTHTASSEREIKDRSGATLATISNLSKAFAFHQHVRVRLGRSLTAPKRDIAAAIVCGFEANATFGE